METWRQVREHLEAEPVVAGNVGASTRLYAERYLLHTRERSVRGLDLMAIVTQFGGARVQEGSAGQWRLDTMATDTLLLPRHCATNWRYHGVVDFAVFYILDTPSAAVDRFHHLTQAASSPLQFSDAVVSATAHQLVNELQKGAAADDQFMSMLADVMLEQTYRVLTTPETRGISPKHAHFSRLQAVLTHITDNLAADLSAQALADIAGVSIAHFRRLFHETVGVPLHRYVQSVRLERARTLLSSSHIPIVQISQDCGFSGQSHLSASFKAVYAATPAEYRSHTLRKTR